MQQALGILDNVTLLALVAAGLWAVMTRSLIRAAIGLALASVLLTVIMFRLRSPLAAVFELSVCSGLISVIFIITISLTNPLTHQEVILHMRERRRRFIFLPFLLIVVGAALSLIDIRPHIPVALKQAQDARHVLWGLRGLDLLGQVIIILAGVFGVAVLSKEMLKK
jgi:NADH-quinone oxidoreductase subunit J